jgi:ATP:corrinoid adenosyltransferase
MFNWAIEQQYISVSPIAKIVKPKRKRREVVYTPDQWKAIQEQAVGSLADICKRRRETVALGGKWRAVELCSAQMFSC